MTKVSVIIPIYNGEKYLKECLDSVCCQSLKDIQIICVNDGSTDKTLSILNGFASKDKRIKIISTENRGQGSARNTALKEAQGEYISFVDADDWISENALELLYFHAKSKDLDMLFFQMINYMDNSKNYVETELYNHLCFERNAIDEDTIFNFNDIKEFLFKIPVCPVSKLYKKEFLDSNDLYFPEGMFFEDNAFFYNSLFKSNCLGFLKKHLYYRRRHADSVTQTFDKRKFDIVKATNKVLDVFLENDQYLIFKKELINHTFSMLLEWFNKSPLELKDEFYRLIKRDFRGFNNLKEDFKNNLKEEYLLIFDISDKNKYYLDFLSEYKLSSADYDIFDKERYFHLNSQEYLEYKSNKSNNYKISVVIPIYNNETFIHRTLMSIENQSFGLENIEVIMVNDNSKDNTELVINEYSSKYENFKAIHIKEGTGSPGTPRNIGLYESTSDYVIFLDHDDYFEIDALEKLYNAINEEDCDFVYGTYASVDEDLPTKIIYPNELHGYFKNIYGNPRSIAFPPPSIWTKLFKRSFLIENRIIFPTILGEDAIFISKALFSADGIDYLWDDLICYHTLNKKSFTKNVSYDYLVQGFVSEEYLYNIYNDFESQSYELKENSTIPSEKSSENIEKMNLYKIRSEGILDFYLNQFYRSDLNDEDIYRIFPILSDFVERINRLGLKPHVYQHNTILFNYILEKDIPSIIRFKKERKKEPFNFSKILKKPKIRTLKEKIKSIQKS